jgi:hypothetical protein
LDDTAAKFTGVSLFVRRGQPVNLADVCPGAGIRAVGDGELVGPKTSMHETLIVARVFGLEVSGILQHMLDDATEERHAVTFMPEAARHAV